MKVDLSKYEEDFEKLETAVRHKQRSRNRLENNNRDPNRKKGKGKKPKTWRDSRK
jgi:hypothetical protein|tara:strand:+ start:1134 stop:1298 length:165 start_codon:yes stop_codon:yes gene_type:complete